MLSTSRSTKAPIQALDRTQPSLPVTPRDPGENPKALLCAEATLAD